MKRGDVYDRWKGEGEPWSRWVKPALFDSVVDDDLAAVDERDPYRGEQPPWAELDTTWLPDRAAVIVDLAGASAVELALALGRRGLRPVLLLNGASRRDEVLPMGAVLSLLSQGARFASCFPAGPTVLPTFVLDARREGRAPYSPGCFDNRWALLSGDLPDAQRLADAGVESVVVVQEEDAPRADLVPFLARYQAAGLRVRRRTPGPRQDLVPFALPAPNRLFAALRERVLLWSLPRRLRTGAFGEIVPTRSSHG